MEAEGKDLVGRPPLLNKNFGAVYETGCISSPSLRSILLYKDVNFASSHMSSVKRFDVSAISDMSNAESL
jgi:hypothetical protein